MDIRISSTCKISTNVEENFIPEKVAILAINAMIIGHWIMSPYPFGDLPEKIMRKNNWFTQNFAYTESNENPKYVNPKYFMIHLRGIARHARSIYTRG